MRSNRVVRFALPAGVAAALFCVDAFATCTSTLSDTGATITCDQNSDVLTLSQSNDNWYHTGPVIGSGIYDWDSSAAGIQYVQSGAQIDVYFPAGATLKIGNDTTAAADLIGTVAISNPSGSGTQVFLESSSSGSGATYEIDGLPGVTTVNQLAFSHSGSAGLGLVISTGTGSDVIDVLSTGVAETLAILGNGDLDHVHFGDAGNTQNIRGAVTITNAGGFTDVTVNDSADAIGHVVTLTSTGLTGLTPAAIHWDDHIRALILDLSTGADALHIQSIDNPAGTTTLLVQGTAGADTVEIGEVSVQAIYAPIALASKAGHLDVVINDFGDPGSRNVIYSATGISGIGPAPITWSSGDIAALWAFQGGGGTVHLLGTAPGATTSIHLGNGNNACYVNGGGLSANTQTAITGGNADDLFVISPLPMLGETLTIDGGPQFAGDEIVYTGGGATGIDTDSGILVPTDPNAAPISYFSIEHFNIGDWLFSNGFE